VLAPERKQNKRPGFLQKIPGGWKGLTVCLSAFFLLGGFLLGQVAGAGTSAVPGSEEDPLVTRSWVESRLGEVSRPSNGEPVDVDLSAVEDRLDRLEAELAEVEAKEPPDFEVVKVEEGKTVYTGQGTEVVVRAGSARIVEGEAGGFSDLTAGESLLSGAGVELNHLLLSARQDGRGLATRSEALMLIRGDYTIE